MKVVSKKQLQQTNSSFNDIHIYKNKTLKSTACMMVKCKVNNTGILLKMRLKSFYSLINCGK